MSKHIPDGGFKFTQIGGYTSLDGNGNPIWTVERKGGKVIFIHNKTGKKTEYGVNVFEKQEKPRKKFKKKK